MLTFLRIKYRASKEPPRRHDAIRKTARAGMRERGKTEATLTRITVSCFPRTIGVILDVMRRNVDFMRRLRQGHGKL